jgi:D-amino peptidase
MGKQKSMKYVLRVFTVTCLVMTGVGAWVLPGYGEPYELSKNDVMDPKVLRGAEVSLFGVKLGDSEAKALDSLVNEKIPGVKAEQEGLFIFLLDQRKPTGPMAGVRIQDGRVDLIFINNRFSYKTRGIFRNVLNSESPDDVRKLLGQEDYGDENVMGAILAYDKQGFVINYLGKDVNVEFSPIR